MLFSRLTWPSLLVQERAANTIGSLLIDKRYEPITLNYLQEWIASQKLESVALKGILILIRAKILDPSYQELPTVDLLRVFQKKSILSWLLFSAYDSQYNEPVFTSLICSGKMPDNFRPDPFFEKYITGFLPPIYNYWSNHIEQTENFPFHMQWAFEWKKIVIENQITQSSIAMSHFWGREYMGRRYTAIDTEMSEVYRSAFLRAIAFGLKNHRISENNAVFLAAETCPIDLELWKIPPQKRPSWWPLEVGVTQQTDTAIGSIWKQVEQLWNSQSIQIGQEWVLGEATGIVQQDETIYDLEIYSVFQKCHGPEEPEIEEIINFIRGEELIDGENNHVSFSSQHPLFFKGKILSESINDHVKRFNDWTVLPTCGYVHPITTPRWQSWRMNRSVWLPAPSFMNKHGYFSVGDGSIVISEESQIIGRWNDWTDGLSEKVFDEAPVRSGQYMFLSSEMVNRFSQVTHSSFCWLCRLNIHYKEGSFGDYKLMKAYKSFGPSRIIK